MATSSKTTGVIGGRTQPTVTPSVSNTSPKGVIKSTQFDKTPPPTTQQPDFFHKIGGYLSGAANAVTSTLSSGAHKVEDFWLGDAKERQDAQKIVHDKLSTQTPQRVLLKKGWDSKAHFDKDGNPVGNWKYNQDNSGGPNANWHENDNGKDEQGNAYDPNDVIHYKGGTWLKHDFGTGTQADPADWIAGNTHHPGIYGYTNPQSGANIHYQLGTQGAVAGNGGSYYLGSALTANNAAVSGRASGALTGNTASYGAASGGSSNGSLGGANYGGGASGSSFSGITSDNQSLYRGND